MNRKGFTLLELLIVILIIGIIATFAMPQYRKIIERSRAAEVMRVIETAKTGQLLYYLQHGIFAGNWNDLKVEMDLNSGYWSYIMYEAHHDGGATDFFVVEAQRTPQRASPDVIGQRIKYTYFADGSSLWEGDHPGAPQ